MNGISIFFCLSSWKIKSLVVNKVEPQRFYYFILPSCAQKELAHMTMETKCIDPTHIHTQRHSSLNFSFQMEACSVCYKQFFQRKINPFSELCSAFSLFNPFSELCSTLVHPSFNLHKTMFSLHITIFSLHKTMFSLHKTMLSLYCHNNGIYYFSCLEPAAIVNLENILPKNQLYIANHGFVWLFPHNLGKGRCYAQNSCLVF